MKFQQLTKEDPLEVMEISYHFKRPIPRENGSYDVIERKKIQTFIFTDGELFREDEPVTEHIDQYFFGAEKYPHSVDTLQKKNMYFKNHRFVITYLVTEELQRIGKIYGWFHIIQDVSIYLENPNDKKSLKDAKRVIRQIHDRNLRIDYSSILGMISSSGRELQSFTTEKVSGNVYKIGTKSFR